MSSVFYQPHNSLGNYNYNIFIYEPCEWAHHFHKNYELVYVMEGAFEAQIDGRFVTVQKGEFVLILPNSIHYFHTPDYSKVWVGVFSEDFIGDFGKEIQGKERSNMAFTCTDVELAYLENTLLNKDCAAEIFSLKASLYMICNRYLKTAEWAERREFDGDLAHRIIGYMEQNFQRNLTLAEVAQKFGYEYHYFSRCFRAMFRMNFKTFLNQLRFDYAKRLIMKSDLDMTTIAMESGFGSLRNFNRIYKELSSTTPRSQRAEAMNCSALAEDDFFIQP